MNSSDQIPQHALKLTATGLLLGLVALTNTALPLPPEDNPAFMTPKHTRLVETWEQMSGSRAGKVVFARPPGMLILDLTTGREKVVPGVVTGGGPGRSPRGRTPRPFWCPDGRRFVYRYAGRIIVSDETGQRRTIQNSRMDCSDETRWSWLRQDETDWLVGPSLDGRVILVRISDPTVTRVAYGGRNVRLHCEITGNGRTVVYDDDRDIYVTPFGSSDKGIRISKGQSCRPCAAPDDRVAWLPTPHTRYLIHRASDGLFLAALNAPPGEEIYRLNWSNDPDFAAHMFGSDSNNRMHLRKISTGAALFIGEGWDPDLWVGPKR
jgi:hypothetical protein